MNFSVHSRVKDLYENVETRAILEEYLPKLFRTPSFQMTLGMSFATLSQFPQWNLSPEQLETVNQKLQAVAVPKKK